MSKHINVASMVSSRDQLPYVMLKVGDQAAQIPVDEARRIAMWLIHAAEAAESDAFFVKFFAETAGLGLQNASGLLREWREAREANLKEENGGE